MTLLLGRLKYIYMGNIGKYISASNICCSSKSRFVSILCGLTIEIAVLAASFEISPPSASNISVFLSSANSICGSVLKLISVCLPDHLSDGWGWKQRWLGGKWEGSMEGLSNNSIEIFLTSFLYLPHICQFCYTPAQYRPVKNTALVRKFAKIVKLGKDRLSLC